MIRRRTRPSQGTLVAAPFTPIRDNGPIGASGSIYKSRYPDEGDRRPMDDNRNVDGILECRSNGLPPVLPTQPAPNVEGHIPETMHEGRFELDQSPQLMVETQVNNTQSSPRPSHRTPEHRQSTRSVVSSVSSTPPAYVNVGQVR
jgi:hypothetical protein